jgi:hypothetical protein
VAAHQHVLLHARRTAEGEALLDVFARDGALADAAFRRPGESAQGRQERETETEKHLPVRPFHWHVATRGDSRKCSLPGLLTTSDVEAISRLT